MGDLSRNFSKHEFACKCGCGFDNVSSELIGVLEEVREYFSKPIKINSGCRCAKHNAKEGGSKDSEHVKGTAADIVVEGIHADKVHEYFIKRYPDKYGIGKYVGRTHIDVRKTKARWIVK